MFSNPFSRNIFQMASELFTNYQRSGLLRTMKPLKWSASLVITSRELNLRYLITSSMILRWNTKNLYTKIKTKMQNKRQIRFKQCNKFNLTKEIRIIVRNSRLTQKLIFLKKKKLSKTRKLSFLKIKTTLTKMAQPMLKTMPSLLLPPWFLLNLEK